MSKEITVKAKAFTGEGVRAHRVVVEQDGTVRVFDSVAGHYTTCHALAPSAIKRIQKLAKDA